MIVRVLFGIAWLAAGGWLMLAEGRITDGLIAIAICNVWLAVNSLASRA